VGQYAHDGYGIGYFDGYSIDYQFGFYFYAPGNGA
jgi:hypothetical protein